MIAGSRHAMFATPDATRSRGPRPGSQQGRPTDGASGRTTNPVSSKGRPRGGALSRGYQHLVRGRTGYSGLARVAIAALIVAACGGAVSPAPTAEPHPLAGTLVLSQSDPVYRANGCAGTGGFDDVYTGTSVVIADGSGTIIATAPLVDSPDAIFIRRCEFTFRADVPDVPFYSVRIGGRDPLVYSREDLARRGWTLALTLGDGD